MAEEAAPTTFAYSLVTGRVEQRPLRDEEAAYIAEWQADAQRAEQEREAAVQPTLEDKLIGALEALPPDRVVSASELLAILRPKEIPDA